MGDKNQQKKWSAVLFCTPQTNLLAKTWFSVGSRALNTIFLAKKYFSVKFGHLKPFGGTPNYPNPPNTIVSK